MPQAERGRVRGAWRPRKLLGKPLNAARLIKASFTFQGAARYAAWKIERHTGVPVEVTPWRERHPSWRRLACCEGLEEPSQGGLNPNKNARV
jgi:hypothetical protein